MREYLLWNPYKVSQYLNLDETEQSVISVLKAQVITGNCVSSYLNLKDDQAAAEISEAILNEIDCTVRIEAIPSRLEVRLYREADYSGFSEAHADGAVYGTGIYFSLTELYDKPDLVEIILNAVGMTSKCINGDQAEIQIVLVDTEQPDQVFDFLHEYAPNFKMV